MKTSRFYLALIILPLFWGCSDDTLSHDNSPTVSKPFSFIGVSDSPVSPASRSAMFESDEEWGVTAIDFMNTRTTIDVNGILGWVKNDEIAVFVKSDNNAVSTSQALFKAGTPSAPDNKTVTFNGSLSGLGTTNTLYAVYPYDSGIKSVDQIATAYKLSYVGLQLGGATVSRLGEYAHMVATPTVHNSSDNLSKLSTLRFAHLNTMMEFKFTLPLATSPITRVCMSTSGEAPLSGDVLIDMTTASTDDAFKKITLADGTALNEIILNDIINKGADGYTAYGMILPGDHSNSSITFDVLTSESGGSNKLYSATKFGTNFMQGSRYYFNDVLALEDKTTTIGSSSSKDFTCGEMMKDERDGKIYKTVKIGEQCWMAENLNVGEFDNTDNEPSDDFWNFDKAGIQKWCYGNLEDNCTTYGGLYEWWEVVSGGHTTKINSENAVNTTLTGSIDSLDYKYGVVLNSVETDVRGICPEAWHIPTLNEWKALGSVKSGWNTIVGSYRVGNGGNMSNLGNSSRWWSSSSHQTSNASYNGFSSTSIGTPTYTYRAPRSSGYSVRCIKDKYIPESVPAVGYQVIAEPFYDYRELSSELKTMSYHRYENPTGLYFQKGDTVTINVNIDPNIASNEIFNFTIIDYGDHTVEPVEAREITQVYQLKQGRNTITVTHEGLGYLPYYVKDNKYATLPNVECTFTGGHINGVFDPIGKGHTNEDWKRLLKDAIFEVIDIRGEYVSLVFPVEFLKNNAQDGVGIIDMFDDIIFWEQELMGLDQYGYRTNNRMFGRISWDGPPSAGGKGINFPNINGFESPDAIRNDCWVIGHEFGHQNQVRPGLKWHGTTEVTTNIYSAWIQYKLKPNGPLRLEHSDAEDGTGNKSVGGIFNWHLNHCVVLGKPFLYVPDGAHKELKPVDFTEPWQYNHSPWPRVVPFWQLQLYNGLTGLGTEDFYAQVSEIVRKTTYVGTSKEIQNKSGELQVAFAKNSCDVMQKDMTDFFINCGMLRAIDDSVSDYGGSRKMLITQAMVNEVVKYAGDKYDKPESTVIHYISVNSLNAFKNKSAVIGQFGQGVTHLENNNYKISHQIWKNVVAFEAYAGEVLKCVTMVGTGTTDNSSTTALVPEGCDRLVAVAWDGIQTEVIDF